MKQEIKKYIPVLILTLFVLILICKIFLLGEMIFKDNPLHIAENYFFIHNVIPDQHWINGWCDWDFVGFPIQSVRYQLGVWMVSTLSFFLGLTFAYKLGVLISLLLPTITLYYLLKNFADHKISFLFSCLFTLQMQYLVRTLEGMWTESLALGFLFLAINYFLKKKNELNPRNISILAIIFAAVILSHIYTAIAFIIFLTSYAIHCAISRQKIQLPKLTLIILLSTLLTSFYAITIIETSSWVQGYQISEGSILKEIFLRTGYLVIKMPETRTLSHLVNAIGTEQFWNIAANAAILSIPSILAFVFGTLGAIKFLYKKNNDNLNIFLIFMIITLITSIGLWNYLPIKLPLFSNLIPARFVLFTRAALIIFGAYLFGTTKLNTKTTYTIALLIAIGTSLFVLDPLWTATQRNIDSEYIEDSTKINEWINQHPFKERILLQSTTGNSENLFLNLSLSNTYLLTTNASYIGPWWKMAEEPTKKITHGSNGQLFNQTTNEISTDDIMHYTELLNIKCYITTEKILNTKLDETKQFEKMYAGKTQSLYCLKNTNHSIIEFEKPVRHEITEQQTNLITLKINNTTPNNLLIKIQQHPYWKASYNNKNQQITPSKEGLITIQLPPEPGELVLRYEPQKWSALIISILTLLVLITLIVINNKNHY